MPSKPTLPKSEVGASLHDDRGDAIAPLFAHVGPDALFLGAARDFCRRAPVAAASVLPPLVRALAKAAGYDAALTLVWEYGGRTIQLPSPSRLVNSWLAETVGADAALAMLPVLEDQCSDSGRINLPSRATVTTNIRVACIGYMADQGHSKARIASMLGLAERTVWRHLAKRRATEESPKE